MTYTFSFQHASLAKSSNKMVKLEENDARTSKLVSLLSSLRGRDWEHGLLSPHGWRAQNFSSSKFVSHVCWAIDPHSSLYIINFPHSYRSMKLYHNLFSFAVILHSILTKQQTCLVPSAFPVSSTTLILRLGDLWCKNLQHASLM